MPYKRVTCHTRKLCYMPRTIKVAIKKVQHDSVATPITAEQCLYNHWKMDNGGSIGSACYFYTKIMSDSIKIFTAIFVVGGGDNAENIEK